MPIGLAKFTSGEPPRRRPVLVRIGAALARTPRVVVARLHEVDLVVALGAVLGLPQVAVLGVEGEPEGVADAVGEDARAVAADRRVRGGHRAVGVHAQDLAAQVAGEILRVRRRVTVAHDRVELAVWSEQDATPVVVRARTGRRRDDRGEAHPVTAALADAQDLVAKLPVDAARDVDVDERLPGPPRMQRHAERTALALAVHAPDAEEQPVEVGGRVAQAHLARRPLEVDDRALRRERERRRPLQARRPPAPRARRRRPTTTRRRSSR